MTTGRVPGDYSWPVSGPDSDARLAAIHSFFRYAALCEPAHNALIQRVLAIPQKRFERALVTYLHLEEIQALLAAPDRFTWTGRRDYTFTCRPAHISVAKERAARNDARR